MHTRKNATHMEENQTGGKESAEPAHAGQNSAVPVQCQYGESGAQQAGANHVAVGNQTGMPDNLKSGLERLSGFDLSPVRVHYDSPKPARLGALAYAQGTSIHLGPGQEKHLPHEGWHVVQQMQGRVRPTTQCKGVDVNDSKGLEHEADVMGARATTTAQAQPSAETGRFNRKPLLKSSTVAMRAPIQRLMGVEVEHSVPVSKVPGGAANADQRIRSFLGAEVKYGTPLLGAAKGYKVEVDHDPMGDAVEGVRNVFNGMINAAGVGAQIPPPTDKYHYIGNMEYVTDNGAVPPAYDERDANQRNAFRKSITDMAQDMLAAHGVAKANVTPLGASGYQYGLPPVVDWQNFAVANGLNQVAVTGWRTNLEGYIHNNLYVQISGGIVPRSISTYLRNLGNNNHLASLNIPPLPGGNHARWIRLLTRDAADAADSAVSHTAGLTRDVRNSKSLRGLVSLMMAYIFGLYFSFRRQQGGAVPLTKNMVAALPRTPLTNVLRELDVSKRPDRWPALQRNNLVAQIILRARNVLNGAPVNRGAGVGGAVADDAGANAFIGGAFDWTTWVDDILTNTGDDIFNNLGGITQIDPHDHPRSKDITPVTGVGVNDDHPRAVAKPPPAIGHTAKTGAVVAEMRLISARPQPNQLLALVDRAINLIRSSNN